MHFGVLIHLLPSSLRWLLDQHVFSWRPTYISVKSHNTFLIRQNNLIFIPYMIYFKMPLLLLL